MPPRPHSNGNGAARAPQPANGNGTARAPQPVNGLPAAATKPSREEKKVGKRAKQLAAMDAKAQAEDRYFQEQQVAMQRSGEAQAAQVGLQGKDADAREAALFARQGAQGIEFGKEWPAVDVSGPGSASAPPLADFESLGAALPPFLGRNIALMNYRKPTPIQQYAVPLALAGCDLMCCAQTGSGKTAAFLVPIVASLASDKRGSTVGTRGAARPRAVVMAPTRELAIQIELEAQKLTNRSALRPVAVYGGADQRGQARALALGGDLVVATPGRLQDFVTRGVVALDGCRFLVLDEADRMLDMGFEPQIRRVVEHEGMPSSAARQTLMFSATFPKEIQKLASGEG